MSTRGGSSITAAGAVVTGPSDEARRVDMGRRMAVSLGLTCLVLLAEIVGGLWTGSLALLSDAAHVFTDVFALAMSYGALRLAARPPNDRHTYGFHRFKVLAALANAVLLLLASIAIFREAWARVQHPAPVLAGPMLGVAVVGLTVNLGVALALRRHDRDDLNARSAFLHVLGDALASLGVIVAGGVILLTGWTKADPVAGAALGMLILVGAGNVLRRSVHILAEGVPEGVDAAQVGLTMRAIPGVAAVHDVHVWVVGPGFVALSAHVVLEDQALSQTRAVMATLKEALATRFGIGHTTIQFECADCGQGPMICAG